MEGSAVRRRLFPRLGPVRALPRRDRGASCEHAGGESAGDGRQRSARPAALKYFRQRVKLSPVVPVVLDVQRKEKSVSGTLLPGLHLISKALETS